MLDEFQANSSAHDSDKAISAYSLGINDNAQYYHFVMDKDTLLALASMILQLTVDEPPSEVVKKNTRKNLRARLRPFKWVVRDAADKN